jgi:HEAT repeat protein
MARKVDRIGEEIIALRLGDDGSSAAIERIRQALRSVDQRIVVAAAQLAGQLGDTKFASDLVDTFERVLAGEQGPDPLCLAKEAVLAALSELGHDDPDVYLCGLKVRQFDPAYGVPPPGEESAGAVRSISALKLPMTGLNTEDLVRSLGPMLFDSSPHVRQNVVRALGACGSWEAFVLIEVKLTAGDDEPGVLGECFSELLNADIGRYLSFVTEYLNDFNPEIRLQAICTLSECRDPLGAEALLASLSPFTESGDLEQIYLALGRCRHETANSFLNDSLDNGSKTEIDLARRALTQRTVPS